MAGQSAAERRDGIAMASTGSSGEAIDLPFVRARSLAEQVADAIVDAIALGRIEPGQRLIETDLARSLGVSRIPIREAVKTLTAQGILESSPHRGAFVAKFDELRIERIRDARTALEKLAAVEAAQVYRKDPGRLGRLDALIRDIEQAASRRDWSAASKADLAFHREICVASGNDIVAKLWETIARHVLIVFGREILSEQDARGLGEQHRRLRDVLASGRAQAVEREIESHVMRLRRNRQGAPRPAGQARAPRIRRQAKTL